jgi:hypothetical protein
VALWTDETARQEALYGRELIVADRDMVETESDAILDGAKDVDVAFLVVGDPFGCVSLLDMARMVSKGLAQGDDTLRPPPPRRSPRDPRRGYSQRLGHERDRRLWPRSLQLWPDRLHPLLYRLMAARQLACADPRELGPRAAHALPARYQGQGAERGEPGEVRRRWFLCRGELDTDNLPAEGARSSSRLGL